MSTEEGDKSDKTGSIWWSECGRKSEASVEGVKDR